MTVFVDADRTSVDEFIVAGVELGGTKCVATLARGVEAVAQVTVLTTGPEATLTALRAVLDGWWRDRRFAALGVASFGPIALDPTCADYGRIITTSKPGWSGARVLDALARGFDVPRAWNTDVNGAALAEGRWGAARGLADFAYVTVGTGVGVGLVVAGRPTRGFGHCELGHIGVARAAEPDWLGHCPFHGACVEGLASGTAIAARLRRRGGEAFPPAGDPFWDEPVEALAQLCQVLALSTAPRRILIGGGVVNGQSHLRGAVDARLRERLADYVALPEAPGDYVIAPGLGDRAGPLGPIAMALTALSEAVAG